MGAASNININVFAMAMFVPVSLLRALCFCEKASVLLSISSMRSLPLPYWIVSFSPRIFSSTRAASILKSVPALLRFFMPSLPCDHSKGGSKGTHGQLVEKLIFLFDHLSNSIYHQGIAHQLQPLKHDVSYDIFSAFGTNFHQAFIILITNKTIDKKSSHNPYTQDYAQFFV